MQNGTEIIDLIDNNILNKPEPAIAVLPEAKKKPGRPKKKPITTPIAVRGIVTEPSNNEDIVELVYCNPTLFKKLMALYKAYEVSEIEWIFEQNYVKILTKDHNGKSTIYVTIYGECMNLYYCKEPVRICIKSDSLESVFSALCKNNYKITIILRENYRSLIYMIVKDLEYNIDNEYQIDVVNRLNNEINAAIDDDTNYPLKFKIAAKHFKTTIANIRKLSTVFIIQKCGTGPLQLTVNKEHKITWASVYNDPAKIELQSTLAEDDIVTVSINIEYIKPFSNSNIGDDVYIAADKREKMCFTTFLDKKENGYACSIKIYSEIKDYRAGQ